MKARLVVLMLIALAYTAQAQSVEQLLSEAHRKAEAGDVRGAGQILDDAAAKNPEDARIHQALGGLFVSVGNRDGAIAHLEKAAALAPRSVPVLLSLGEAYESFGELPQALNTFQKAVDQETQNVEAQVSLGRTLLQLGNLPAALSALNKAISLNGSSAEAAYPYYLRAKIYAEQNDVSKATSDLRRATTLRPDLAEAWSDLGLMLRLLSDNEAALQSFERAVRAKPADPVAQYRLGAEYLRRERYREAVEHLNRALALNADDQSTLYSLQLALRKSGDTAKAQRIKDQLSALLLQNDARNQNAVAAIRINNEGSRLEHNGQLREALEHYRQALALNPDHVGIRVNLAIALLRLGSWKEGIAQLRESVRRDSGNAQLKAALEDALRQAPAWAR